MMRLLVTVLLISVGLLVLQAQTGILSADAAELYNTGIAQQEAGDTAQAVLLFQRAALAAPRDAQIQSALAGAAPSSSTPTVSLSGISDAAARLLTLKETSILAFLLWNLFFLLASLGLMRPDWRSTLVPLRHLSLMALLAVAGLWTVRLYSTFQQPLAIVMQTAPARTGPGDDYLALPSVAAGQVVHQLERRGEWVRVLLRDQSSAWIVTSVVEQVIPVDSAASE